MKVWVTRDGGKAHHANRVELWAGVPTKEQCVDGYYYFGDEASTITDIATISFKQLFGFTPRKGSCKQYEPSLKEI